MDRDSQGRSSYSMTTCKDNEVNCHISLHRGEKVDREVQTNELEIYHNDLEEFDEDCNRILFK